MDRSFFRFVTMHVCDRETDSRTDGQNFHRYLSHRDLSQWCPWWMHPAIIIGTVRVLWTWLWAHTTFHRSENTCLVSSYFFTVWLVAYVIQTRIFVVKDRWTSPLLCSFVVAVVNLLFLSCTVYSSDVLAHAFDVCR